MDASRSGIGRTIVCESDGRGALGCLFSLMLLGIVVFVAFKIGPSYYAFKNFETDVKTEVSRAGAHFYDDETLVRGLMDLARKNEIRLEREDISIERFAGQLHVRIQYSIPVDLIVRQRDLHYDVAVSSFIGRL